jgi:hypothetical protein
MMVSAQSTTDFRNQSRLVPEGLAVGADHPGAARRLVRNAKTQKIRKNASVSLNLVLIRERFAV